MTKQQCHDKLREKFLENKHVKDLRAIDVLVIKVRTQVDISVWKLYLRNCSALKLNLRNCSSVTDNKPNFEKEFSKVCLHHEATSVSVPD